ncbi:uncharacterized protein NPIL_702451 [Nephila pilipes]|uniref:Uncharacterized protein n=1 Tax=Nephila pilipes TaxID=299642 RepID=A0A8X6U5V2_NEPPI|nr:uncharacterized protein NPIL_296461 [Nephila pilipes]GFU18430.1 uncharacterized protein NPIL_702451 [Nephila pilipes]
MVTFYFSDVKKSRVIRARFFAASVSRTANIVAVSRTPRSRVMTTCIYPVKMSFAKHNSGRKSKFKDRDGRVLKSIVTQKRKTKLPQITSEMNTHLQTPRIHENYRTRVVCCEYSW